ncbi:hypothetical protein QYF61_017765 [Mycteria americana]|uniref:RNase H type-1 domain-containing protein n=1 Tax=Mycteria americana TaxID=33587 RepID=A0AAN7NHN8_MYCAM|nr:hypothetical protein QYF61_017765 [Mycteria americana]
MGEEIQLLQDIQQPKEVAVMHCKAHQFGQTMINVGNRLADKTSREAAEQSILALVPIKSTKRCILATSGWLVPRTEEELVQSKTPETHAEQISGCRAERPPLQFATPANGDADSKALSYVAGSRSQASLSLQSAAPMAGTKSMQDSPPLYARAAADSLPHPMEAAMGSDETCNHSLPSLRHY